MAQAAETMNHLTPVAGRRENKKTGTYLKVSQCKSDHYRHLNMAIGPHYKQTCS